MYVYTYHVSSNIVRIDSAKTSCMQINHVIELRDNLVHQMVAEHLTCITIAFTRKLPVEITAICKLALKLKEAPYINTGHSNDCAF